MLTFDRLLRPNPVMNSRFWGFLYFLCVLCVCAVNPGFPQQVADPNFDARVARPAYTERHPKILFDEAHFNFDTTTGRFKPFTDLIANDGYQVTPNKEKFSKKTLAGYDALVIANALGARGQMSPAAGQPAFTEEECDAVRDWVQEGGALLLIADHAPFGAAAENLARRFGVDMSKGYTADPANHDAESGNHALLLFTRENGLLADHPITRGRNEGERIGRVMTFSGQSLKGPESSAALLKLADTAVDTPPPSEADIQAAIARARAEGGGAVQLRMSAEKTTSAAGRAQGLAFPFGKGRVVVLGEAAMLSAQVVQGEPARRMGKETIQMGMNRPGIDNRQLTLNILHWLSKLID